MYSSAARDRIDSTNEKAVTGYFYNHKNNYFILGEHYYWYMDYPDNMAVDLINRTTVNFLEYNDGNYRFSEKDQTVCHAKTGGKLWGLPGDGIM